MLSPEIDQSVATLLWAAAERHPDHPAVVERGASTDYATINERASAVASGLRAMGVRDGERVAMFLERNADAVAAFFGVAAANAVAVILNETLRPRQVEHILRHASARVLVTSSAMLARQPRALETPAAIVLMENIERAPGFRPLARVGGDVAQIIYTSGSTGQPKGVTLSHANIWAGIRAVTTYVEIGQRDRIASLLPFSFDYGFNQMLCAVAAGATLIVERSPIPQQIVSSLRQFEATVLAAVPPLWLQLLAVPDFLQPVPSLRAMTNTGGRLPVDAVRKLRRAHPSAHMFLMYGLTEAFRSTFLPSSEVDRHPDSIGRAIPGAEIMVVREDLTPCAADEVGELVHRGPTVAMGYWNDPETTNRVYRPNPLRPSGAPDSERVVFSGDLVKRDADGLLYYVARRDRLIKTMGYRVSPDEVADALYASGEVVEAIVDAEPDPDRGERIVAYVVLAERGTLDRLQAFCKTELPRYLQPARIDVRSALPRTNSGKHDVQAVRTS